MLLFTFCASTLLAFILAVTAFSTPLTRRSTDDDFTKIALNNVYKVLNSTLSDGSTHTTCTKSNIAVRKEFGGLTIAERDDYVRSVKCLMNTTSMLDPKSYPGAKSRYDDFVVVHMNMTPSVHGTANFLHWHRYYIWAYEEALRSECAYKGYQPYWNWGKCADPTTFPIPRKPPVGGPFYIRRLLKRATDKEGQTRTT